MKDERIHLRLSKKTKENIQKNAEKAGLSLSEYCLIRAENKEMKARISPEEIDIYMDLLSNKKNFQAISNFMKNMNQDLLIEEVRALINKMNSHLKKFK